LQRVVFPAEDVVAVVAEAGAIWSVSDNTEVENWGKMGRKVGFGMEGYGSGKILRITKTPHKRLTPILWPKTLIIETRRVEYNFEKQLGDLDGVCGGAGAVVFECAGGWTESSLVQLDRGKRDTEGE